MIVLHWETITPLMHEILRVVGQSDLCPRFYLAGGTALALQLGHRRSVDLDFFSETDEVRPTMHSQALRVLQGFNPTTVEQAWGDLLRLVQELRVGFFSYGYPLVSQTISAEGVPLASFIDLGLMKMDAIATRATRKDFHDLYAIVQHIPPQALLEMSQRKYPRYRDFPARVLRYMVYFDNAEQEEPVSLMNEASWSDVKKFFREQVVALAPKWWR